MIRFLLITPLFLLLSCQTSNKRVFTTNPTTQQANIIFIMADDLGYGDLGVYGQKIIKTPYLDQMAKEGMVFSQVYAGSPVCAPSRSVLMTGQHTGHTTVRGNHGYLDGKKSKKRKDRIPLKQEDITIAKVLQDAGYITGMTGKWGLGEPNTTGIPTQQGFNQWFGYLNQRNAHSYYPPYLWKNEEKIILPGNQNGKQNTYSHDLFTKFALEFVEKNHAKPFFLYLPYTIPHDKYEIPDVGIYKDSTHWKADEQVHAAMVSRMDKDIGQLIALLKKLAIDEKTIIFFCSDNGAAKRWEGRFDSSGALKGRKRDLYEGGIRTPMIVRMPQSIPAGVINDMPWHFMDVLPTLAALGKAPLPPNIDGQDISPTFFNPTWQLSDRSFYWEFYERGFQQAVRWKNWKGVKLNKEKTWELYDLEKDPSEKTNIASQHPNIIKKLKNIAAKEHRPSVYY
jgi:arylsulfatase A-like enzyme